MELLSTIDNSKNKVFSKEILNPTFSSTSNKHCNDTPKTTANITATERTPRKGAMVTQYNRHCHDTPKTTAKITVTKRTPKEVFMTTLLKRRSNNNPKTTRAVIATDKTPKEGLMTNLCEQSTTNLQPSITSIYTNQLDELIRKTKVKIKKKKIKLRRDVLLCNFCNSLLREKARRYNVLLTSFNTDFDETKK